MATAVVSEHPLKSSTDCCVIGCSNSYANTVDMNISFHKFPIKNKFPGKYAAWISAVRRINSDGSPWVPSSNNRVCSVHFVGGVQSNDPLDPSYKPTIFPPQYSLEGAIAWRNLRPENSKEALPETNEHKMGTRGTQKNEELSTNQEASERVSRVYRKLQTDAILGLDNLKAMDKHTREARKVVKRGYTEPMVRSMYWYDDRGILIRAQRDLCDCLNETCPGCHFPCKKCKSTKCGPECRCSRKWVYEQVEIEGTDVVLHTPMKPKSGVGGHQYYH